MSVCQRCANSTCAQSRPAQSEPHPTDEVSSSDDYRARDTASPEQLCARIEFLETRLAIAEKELQLCRSTASGLYNVLVSFWQHQPFPYYMSVVPQFQAPCVSQFQAPLVPQFQAPLVPKFQAQARLTQPDEMR